MRQRSKKMGRSRSKLHADTRHAQRQRQQHRPMGQTLLVLMVLGLFTASLSRTNKSAFIMTGLQRATRSSRRQKVVVVTPEPAVSSAAGAARGESPPAKALRRLPFSLKAVSTSSSASEVVVGKPRAFISSDIDKIAPAEKFQDLCVSPAELRPSATLTTGQCFHWQAVDARSAADKRAAEKGKAASAWGSHDATEWIGTLRVSSTGDSVVLAVRETPETTMYKILKGPEDLDVHAFLRSYFQLDEKLVPLYREWSESCGRLSQIAECIPGVRIIDQDPWECLISFICSSNNNIPRIAKMLGAIRREYGEPLLTVGDQILYSFPRLETLLAATDDELRQKCGMGYRSKYLLETMRILESLGGESYLQELRSIEDPAEVQEKLMQFCGVGRKVADCVALFSLTQDDAVPVDVHVWNIARRDYDTERLLEKVKSLTPATYRQVGDLFRNKFQSKCGWAHSLLFVAELPSFRPTLPQGLIDEMEKFRKEEQLRKETEKVAKRKRQEEKSLTKESK